MRKLLGFGSFLLALIGCVALTGCGPELSKQELGTVVFEMPSVEKKTQPNAEAKTEESGVESDTAAKDVPEKDVPKKDDSEPKENSPALPQ
jgi:hypothetical protein